MFERIRGRPCITHRFRTVRLIYYVFASGTISDGKVEVNVLVIRQRTVETFYSLLVSGYAILVSGGAHVALRNPALPLRQRASTQTNRGLKIKQGAKNKEGHA